MFVIFFRDPLTHPPEIEKRVFVACCLLLLACNNLPPSLHSPLLLNGLSPSGRPGHRVSYRHVGVTHRWRGVVAPLSAHPLRPGANWCRIPPLVYINHASVQIQEESAGLLPCGPLQGPVVLRLPVLAADGYGQVAFCGEHDDLHKVLGLRQKNFQ